MFLECILPLYLAQHHTGLLTLSDTKAWSYLLLKIDMKVAGLDRRFHLKASATKNTEWSAYDNTIWNQVFPDSTAKSYQPRPQPIKYNAALMRRSSRPVQPNSRHLICLDWNNNPDGCSHSPCCYEHSCYNCIHNPRVTEKNVQSNWMPTPGKADVTKIKNIIYDEHIGISKCKHYHFVLLLNFHMFVLQ